MRAAPVTKGEADRLPDVARKIRVELVQKALNAIEGLRLARRVRLAQGRRAQTAYALRCPLLIALTVVAPLLSGAVPQPDAPVLEYIAHASFVLTSPGGTRVAIDPFNGDRWLGYSFPSGLQADVVLVSHPHYDHDASYYFRSGTPVFRRPGRYRVGDVTIEGHHGRHADPFGQDFEQVNTIWVIESGGVRVAHLGDNGPPPAQLVASLGRVDVLLVPTDSQEHILTDASVTTIQAALRPRITIPMHYRLQGFRDLPTSLGPLGTTWLSSAERRSTHRLVLEAATLALPGRAIVLAPSPAVRPWPDALAQAWRWRDAGRPGTGAAASRDTLRRVVPALRQAAGLAPTVIVFQFELASALKTLGRTDEALGILERSLSAADQQDAEYTMRARVLLGELYASRGWHALAAAQYRLVADGSSRPAQIKAATEFLLSHPDR